MRAIKTFLVMLLTINIVANADIIIKGGFLFNFGEIENFEINTNSVEFDIEKTLGKKFSLGFGIRKDTDWLFSGLYLKLYPKYQIQISEKFFVSATASVEYGISNSKYDKYQAKHSRKGELVFQKWVYIIQNAPVIGDMLKKGSTGTVYPFLNLSLGYKLTKNLFIEPGIQVKLLKFKVISSQFNHQVKPALVEIDEQNKWIPLYSVFIKFGINL